MTIIEALKTIKARGMENILKAALKANPTRTKESVLEAILGIKILTKKEKKDKLIS